MLDTIWAKAGAILIGIAGVLLFFFMAFVIVMGMIHGFSTPVGPNMDQILGIWFGSATLFAMFGIVCLLIDIVLDG